MRRKPVFLLAVMAILISSYSWSSEITAEKHLYFREAAYYSFLGRDIDAITRIDAAFGRSNNGLMQRIMYANSMSLPLASFELNYRMSQRANDIIRSSSLLPSSKPSYDAGSNALARLFLQKNKQADALGAIDLVKGSVAANIRDDVSFTRAQVFMANKQPAGAINLLNDIQSGDNYAGFATYNIAAAYKQLGKGKKALSYLNKTGRLVGSNEIEKSIIDKANLVLGYKMLNENRMIKANKYLERVRLHGPFSNRALLGLGWAATSLGEYKFAIASWGELVKRNIADEAVQEALLGLPYAYGKLNAHGKAANLYEHTVNVFAKEVVKLNASIDAISKGGFVSALVGVNDDRNMGSLIRLREIPGMPDTHYLLSLIASHDFQESLKNYRDLDNMRLFLLKSEQDIIAYQELTAIRKKYYDANIADFNKKVESIDLRIARNWKKYYTLYNRLRAMMSKSDPEFLIGVNEKALINRLSRLERIVVKNNRNSDQYSRIERLKGVIKWSVYSQYNTRLQSGFRKLAEIVEILGQLSEQKDTYALAYKTALDSYIGMKAKLDKLGSNILRVQQRIKQAQHKQRKVIEAMAIAELERRRKKLLANEMRAQFELATSYDRVAKKQLHNGGGQ